MNLEIIQIARRNGETYDSVRSVLLMNTPGFSNTVLRNQASYATSYQSVYSFGSRLQWPFWIFMVWVLGTLLSIWPVLRGFCGVMVLRDREYTEVGISITALRERTMHELGISKRVRVPILVSGKCQTPYVCGIFCPNILVPEDFDRWSIEQQRVVLIHEFSHIKRQDLLTQSIARVCCSLFWFLPFLWLSYSHLRIEQEKSCDAMTIRTGMYPADFAANLVGLIRHMKEHVFTSAVFIFKGRKRMIEKRIVNALQLRNRTSQNKSVVGYLGALLLICLASLLVMNPVSAENTARILGPNEVLFGTWVNTDYNRMAQSAKIKLHADGTGECYAKTSSIDRLCGDTYIIEDTWTDEDKNIWYKIRSSSDRYYYELHRINKNGDCLEYVYSPREYPLELSEDHPNYRIYYKLQ
jgi:beta-lactamase regulating signal transducer with metallopeptidase domain